MTDVIKLPTLEEIEAAIAPVSTLPALSTRLLSAIEGAIAESRKRGVSAFAAHVVVHQSELDAVTKAVQLAGLRVEFSAMRSGEGRFAATISKPVPHRGTPPAAPEGPRAVESAAIVGRDKPAPEPVDLLARARERRSAKLQYLPGTETDDRDHLPK